MIDMNEAMKAACILHGYWTGLIVCGRELPPELEVSMSVAHLVASTQGKIAGCDDLVEAMMLDVDRIENEAVRELARRAVERN